ncbi:CoA pyrophosphatase [Aliifodinibius salicampi]|uniref:CoA pyrophosphatase n=1 Tax=Fodinibius salicampi TaxID=1920655 RepID=A0ABT3PYU3_9BACT|nr:CoA pyrophosphatase [Fodinibius salicampi]MCW9712966.1 CoA pyrophosphatase [Fodinibius salicampi]
MQKLINFLTDRLSGKLPGTHSQLAMAPEPLDGGDDREMDPPEHASRSSVLLLLFPNDENNPELVLTLRSHDIDHGGQISFPGGRSEKKESVRQTALREAREEIGVSPNDITIIGELSELYISNSNNLVFPVVGYTDNRPTFTINPAEVEEVFAVELDSLVHKKNITVEDWDLHSYTYRVPYWDVHPVPLWGATAMMLNEFLDLYREFLTEHPPN